MPCGHLSWFVSAQVTSVAVAACLVCGVSTECKSPAAKEEGCSLTALGHVHALPARDP